jgi:TolA-binding protein
MKKSVLFLFAISYVYSYEVPIKDVVLQNRSDITYLKSKINEQKEKIDGMMSLIDGMNQTINELKQNQRFQSQNDNTKLLKDLGKMIDKINSDYVSKQDLQKIMKNYNHKVKTVVSTPINDISKLTSKELYSKAIKAYSAKDYATSKKLFALCDKKSYRQAQSNFYLGEMSYYSKVYEDALFYYKKSASLKSDTSYMPVLILHSAISLDKTNKKEQAKIFYQNVIDNYPDTKSAKIAKSRLEKLK